MNAAPVCHGVIDWSCSVHKVTDFDLWAKEMHRCKNAAV